MLAAAPMTAAAIRSRHHDLHDGASAVDDFGTGYSSIAYLTAFPVDLVKFDAPFTHRASEDERSAVVVRSIITLMHGLGASGCLQGTETTTHLRSAGSLGADFISGYLLARPMPELQLRSAIANAIPVSCPPHLRPHDLGLSCPAS